MAVEMRTQGQNVVVTVTTPLNQLGFDLEDYTPAQRQQLVARLAIDELNRAVEAAGKNDQDIDGEYDQRVSDVNKEREARKASRPDGNL